MQLHDLTLTSRLILGTGKFASDSHMRHSMISAQTQIATLAIKRHSLEAEKPDNTLTVLRSLGLQLLPNTSGARTAEEAVFAARLARTALDTPWIKLEIHPDAHHLLPDPIETLRAAEKLVQEGFVVLPYCPADPVLCRHLEEAGCAAVMPLGSPIGSNKGLVTRDFIAMIIEDAHIPVIVDAGLGKPSDAAAAMEMGADAVLVNTAIATARDPEQMAGAFASAVKAGRSGYEAGLASQYCNAVASSPLTSFLGGKHDCR